MTDNNIRAAVDDGRARFVEAFLKKKKNFLNRKYRAEFINFFNHQRAQQKSTCRLYWESNQNTESRTEILRIEPKY